MDFKELITSLNTINSELRDHSVRAVNTSLTLRNWFFGFYIIEFEQNGNDRAVYGEALISRVAVELKSLKISNCDERELRRYRQFYIVYPNACKFIEGNKQILNNLSIELLETRFGFSDVSIRGLPNPELVESKEPAIRGAVNPEFKIEDNHYFSLFNRISYSHFKEIIRIDDYLKRLFYELECLKGNWSVSDLKRQIDSLLYERTGLSKNKEKLLALANTNKAPQSFNEIIRDPYIFEFVGLKQQDVLVEKEMEQALLDHLLQFLLELGKGFCFEARQKRILIDNEHHFVDMVFYHRILHCNVLVELKTERFNHTHAGQLNLYLEYFKKYEMAPGDNPPVGILLCTDKDQEHVEFATAGLDDKVFVAKYLVALPNEKELEQFIKNELKENWQQKGETN